NSEPMKSYFFIKVLNNKRTPKESTVGKMSNPEKPRAFQRNDNFIEGGIVVHNRTIADVKLYINGEFTEAKSNAHFDNMNPFTNKVINEVSEGDEPDIHLAVEAAHNAFISGPWGSMKLEERMIYIDRI